MKKSLIGLSALFLTMGIVGCNNQTSSNSSDLGSTSSSSDSSSSVNKEGVDYIYNLLTNRSILLEVENSNKVKFTEVNEDSNRIEKTEEDIHILNNQQTYYYGTYEVEYHQTPSFNSQDSYIRKSEVKDYEGTKIYYDVTDYENSNQKDRATRLPIVKNGDPNEDGVSYLLEESVNNQLCKQSSLFVAQFIDTYLLNNVDLGGIVPAVYYEDNGDNTTSYYLNDFSYSYEDGGIVTEISISFNILLETETSKFLWAETVYETKETQGENDSYFTKDTLTYEVSYGERESSVEKSIECEDYFIQEVNKIRAYVLDGENKTYYDLDALPINKYIRFEAVDYSPSKAVDIMMYPLSSSKEIVTLDTETCYSETPISSLITFETATGINFSQDVTFVKPLIEDLNFSCSSDIMEKEYDENYDVTYLIYNDTSYDSIYLSTSEGKLEKDDIVIEIEHPELITLNEVNVTDKMITYELVVGSNETNITETSITFKSLSNENVKEVVKFKLKSKLEGQDLIDYMINHLYTYKNIYTNLVYKVDFTSETEGIYYDNNGEEEKQIPFTYKVNDYYLDITFSSDTYYQYDNSDMKITRDGNNLKFFVGDGSYATHVYVAE